MDPWKILVVAGSRSEAELLEALLADEGHQLCTALGGEAALSLLVTFDPDIVISPADLAGAVGAFELMRESGERGACARFVLIEPDPSVDAHREAWLAGAEGFLARPLQREQVLQVVREVGMRLLPHQPPTEAN